MWAFRATSAKSCWDLRAQAQKTPLWRLWGGAPEVPLSWTVTREKPSVMAREAADMVDKHGFRTLKIKGGQGFETDAQALKEICGILPAMHSPTISHQTDPEWVSLEVMLDEKQARNLIPRLKRRGASGIIEYPLNKVIP